MDLLENITVFCHSSIKFNRDKIIYCDPFEIEEEFHDADYIFITHSHYDHYNPEAISKVRKEETIFVAPKDVEEKLKNDLGVDASKIASVIPDQIYDVEGLRFSTVAAYNRSPFRPFHPKKNGWVGYIITIDSNKYFVAGDTDANEENLMVACDVAFIPVGGTYTMDAKEAAIYANVIKPKIAVPIHYGSVVGKKEDGQKFIDDLDKEIEGRLLIK